MAALVFLGATDWDGYLARKYHQRSKLGQVFSTRWPTGSTFWRPGWPFAASFRGGWCCCWSRDVLMARSCCRRCAAGVSSPHRCTFLARRPMFPVCCTPFPMGVVSAGPGTVAAVVPGSAGLRAVGAGLYWCAGLMYLARPSTCGRPISPVGKGDRPRPRPRSPDEPAHPGPQGRPSVDEQLNLFPPTCRATPSTLATAPPHPRGRWWSSRRRRW